MKDVGFLTIVAFAALTAGFFLYVFFFGGKTKKQWFGDTSASTLVTGLPGNGKTLFVVSELEKMAKEFARQMDQPNYKGPEFVIYTHGIKELAIPGCASLLDPKRWHELPTGSVVVIDEAQKTFVKRANGAPVPPYAAAAETLRHDGKRLVLITQDPGLIDSHVRALIGQHLHIERLFGMSVSTVFEWPKVKAIDNKTERKAAQKTQWPHPVESYKLYKSAEIHTIKRHVPMVVKIFAVSLFVMVAGLVLAVKYVTSNTNPFGKNEPAPTEQVAATSSNVPGTTAPPTVGRSVEPKPDYFESRIARIEGLPHTAPIYDSITTPTQAPKPVACAAMGDRCNCFTQQGTRITSMREEMCRQIVDHGYFDDSAPIQANGPIAPSAPHKAS